MQNYRSVSCTLGEVPIQRQHNGFAHTSGNGTAKVLAGPLLQKQVKVLCAVDPRTIDKRLQDFPPLAPEYPAGDEGVLVANLLLILCKPLLRRAKNGKIDIDKQLLVCTGWHPGVPRSHHERVDVCDSLFWHSSRGQLPPCPICASLLVVATLDVVDGIMEPKSQLDLRRSLCKQTDRIKRLKAFGEMLDRVVAAMRLAIRRNKLPVQRGATGLGSDLAPGAFK